MSMTVRQPNMNDKNGTNRQAILRKIAARDDVRPQRKPNSTASADATKSRRAAQPTMERMPNV